MPRQVQWRPGKPLPLLTPKVMAGYYGSREDTRAFCIPEIIVVITTCVSVKHDRLMRVRQRTAEHLREPPRHRSLVYEINPDASFGRTRKFPRLHRDFANFYPLQRCSPAFFLRRGKRHKLLTGINHR